MASRVLFAMSRDGLLTGRAAVRERGRHADGRRCWSAPSWRCCSSSSAARSSGSITVLAFFFVANYALSFVVGVRAAASRAGQAAAVPGVGLSVDDGARAGGIDRVPDRRDRERYEQQRRSRWSCSPRATRVSSHEIVGEAGGQRTGPDFRRERALRLAFRRLAQGVCDCTRPSVSNSKNQPVNEQLVVRERQQLLRAGAGLIPDRARRSTQ